jgi:excisionase family DNA binding protein
MFTVAEFAEMSRLSRPTIYRLIEAGDIGAIRLAGTIRIPATAAAKALGQWNKFRPAPAPGPERPEAESVSIVTKVNGHARTPAPSQAECPGPPTTTNEVPAFPTVHFIGPEIPGSIEGDE